MLYVQLKHPITLATLLFLAVGGVAIRWNEYSLPRYLRQVNTMADVFTALPPRTVPAASENAAPLYEEANRLLNVHWLEEPDEDLIWDKLRAWYLKSNGPSGTATTVGRFPLPEDLRHSLEEYIGKRRDALALVHRAAGISTVTWTVHGTLENPRHRSWPWNREIVGILLFEMLLNMDDHNEVGALHVIAALNAFVRAQEHIEPPVADGRHMLSRWPWELVLNNGIETGLFSDAALDVLDEVFSYEEDPGTRAIRRLRLESRSWAYGPLNPSWRELLTYKRFGSFWYGMRFSSRNSMKEVLLYELLVKSQHKAISADGYTELWNTFRQVDESRFFINAYGLVYDPFTSDRLISGIDCSTEYLLYILLREYHSLRWRLTMRTVLALEKYRRHNGDFPDSLEALSPDFLSSDLLRIARDTIVFRQTQAGWEITNAPNTWDRFDRILYTYPLLTPEE